MPFPLNLPGPGPLLPFHENPETGGGPTDAELQAAQPDFASQWFDSEDPDDAAFWIRDNPTPTVLDAMLPLIAGVEPIELQVAQNYDEPYQWPSGLDEDWYGNVYGFPDQNTDITPTLFPPPVDELFFAQPDPSIGQDIGVQFPDPDPTNDQPYVEQNEGYLSPNDAFDVTIATQPLAEQPWFDDEPTQDYDDSPVLDVTAQLFPPSAQDDSYVAALDLPDSADFTDSDWEFSPFLDQLEGYLSPNDAFDVTIATQPLAEFGAEFYTPDETQDYANDSTLDVTPAFFQPDVTDEFQAAQYVTLQGHQDPQYWPDPDPTNNQPLVDGAVEALLAPPPFAPDEVMAAQLDPSVGQDQALWPPDDYTNDQPLVDGAVEAFQSPNDAFDVTIAAVSDLPDQWVAEETLNPDIQVEGNEAFLSIPTSDDGYIAAQDLPDQTDFTEEPWHLQWHEDGAVASFLAGDDGYVAALDLPDQTYWPADETENYIPLSALDSLPAVLFPPAPATGGPFPILKEGLHDTTIELEGVHGPISKRGLHDTTIELEGVNDRTIRKRGLHAPTETLP